MKYLAIQYYRGGFHAIIDDNGMDTVEMRVNGMETVDQNRKLYNFLRQNGFVGDERGVIHVVAFGVCRLELMGEMLTLPRYVCFDGGMLNPNLLYADRKSGMIPEREGSDRPDVIIEMVRKFFYKRTIKEKINVGEKIENERHDSH
jgi:hypothetical protein